MAAELWDLFEQESEDFLAQIEEALSGSAADLKDPATMGSLFRAFHSLKGIAASLGLSGVESIAHRGEDLLELFRSGEAEPDAAALELLLHASDALVSLREDCIAQRSDLPGDAGLLSALIQAKDQLRGGGTLDAASIVPVTPSVPVSTPDPAPDAAPTPEPPPDPIPDTDPVPDPPSDPTPTAPAPSMGDAEPSTATSRVLEVSTASADPDEIEFQSQALEPFTHVVASELGQLAEALENPTLDVLDTTAISGSILAIREAASEAGYLGIVEVLSAIQAVLQESDPLDRTALTRGLCLFVHRLRVLSELSGSGLSMDDVDDSMSPHISREAREVIDRLSVAGGTSRDWELVGVLARALGVFRISALARLTSELTVLDDWRDRPGAVDAVDEIRKESQVIGIEGLSVAALDMRHGDYDRLRDQMALLLTNAAAGVAALRDLLGDEIFNSLSPDARNRISEFLEQPQAVLVEIRALLPDGDAVGQALLAALFQQQVMSNRVLVDIDPNLYQFLIGVTGSPSPLISSLQAIDGTSGALRSWAVAAGEAPADPAGASSAPEAPETPADPVVDPGPATDGVTWSPEDGARVLFVDDDAWDDALKRDPPAAAAAEQPIEEPRAPPEPASSPTIEPEVTPRERPQPEAPVAEPPPPAIAPADSPNPQDASNATAAGDAPVPAERGNASPSRSTGGGSLRVSSELIDQYLDTVAELRLSLSRLDQGAAEAGFASTTAELRSLATQTGARKAERLRAAAAQIDNAGKVIANQIARAETTLRMLHSVTLDLRVVPISIVLGRMPRLVRDLSRSLGKQVNLEIEDGDIQIDKSMVDALTEPLVHMIRNAMDHGIERSEERRQSGKPEKATLSLKATQNGSVAQIMIADDGRGLNTAKIRAKAMERGLISEQDSARMSEREIHRQIFAPGFSTAAAVTETSGRGVGMDVVLVTMRRLGGSIDIDSVEGEGTRFYLSFPVSAALQRIIVVTDGERDLGLPERAIMEVIEVDERSIQTVGDLSGIQHRDGFLPVRPIETMLGWQTPAKTEEQRAFPVVIIGSPQRRVGVAVAQVKRRQEVFMKELHPALSAVDVLAGATVMGEGQPLLVLDPETLIAIAGT